MADWAAKRFWKEASVVEAEAGFSVTLDGRGVKTPLKTPIVVPNHALATAMAEEWDAQDVQIDPLTMPVTRAVNATLDKVIPQHGEVADMLAAYGESDLLCYRALTPQELIARQADAWDPLLDWADARYGVRLNTTQGVMSVAQDPVAVGVMNAEVHRLSAWEMTAFHEFVTLSGSLVIALAIMEGHDSVEALWNVSRIDENWQEEKWGVDDEATALANSKRDAFFQAARFLTLLRSQ